MLVLTRRDNQAVIIPGLGKIVAIECKHGAVRLGLEFPKDVPIVREELLRQEPTVSNRRPVAAAK